jgi:hypothetical protein
MFQELECKHLVYIFYEKSDHHIFCYFLLILKDFIGQFICSFKTKIEKLFSDRYIRTKNFESTNLRPKDLFQIILLFALSLSS